jgi:tetratricopeptide (TPR) repeat protein
MKKKLFIIFTFSCVLFSYAQENKIDSLLNVLNNTKDDTARFNTYLELVNDIQYSNLDTAVYFLNQAEKIAEKIPGVDGELRKGEIWRQKGWNYFYKSEYKKAYIEFEQAIDLGEKYLTCIDSILKNKAQKLYAASLGSMGVLYTEQGNFNKALYYNLKALKINEAIGDKYYIAANLGNIGLIYSNQGNYAKALEFYFKALKINEETGNKRFQSANLSNIGNVYSYQGDFDKALIYTFKALKIHEELGNKKGQAIALGNIGLEYSNQGNFEKALEYYFKALNLDEDLGNINGQARHIGNIGLAYYYQGDYTKSLEYHINSLKLNEEIENKQGQAIALGNIGNVYTKLKQYSKAEASLNKAVQLNKEFGSITHLKDAYENLFSLYETTNQYKKALYYYKEFILCRDSILSQENQKALIQKEMQYEYDKKEAMLKAEQEKKDVIAKADKQRQQLFILLIGAVAAAISVIALLVYRSLTLTKKQKMIIEHQKHLVEEKQKEILDSIRYARRIQHALLPPESYIEKHLKKQKKV